MCQMSIGLMEGRTTSGPPSGRVPAVGVALLADETQLLGGRGRRPPPAPPRRLAGVGAPGDHPPAGEGGSFVGPARAAEATLRPVLVHDEGRVDRARLVDLEGAEDPEADLAAVKEGAEDVDHAGGRPRPPPPARVGGA